VPEQTLAPITVEASADASGEGLKPAYAGGQVARGSRTGLLGNTDTMDTPFNATQYTNTLIKDQQAASVADILQNDPGVSMARGFGNFQQVYKVRGFPLYSDDITYNGLYGLLPRQYLAAEFIERLDVLRGANAFLNGAAPGGSGIGGAVNVVPKRAPNEPLSQVTMGWESGDQGKAAVDLGRRFGPDNSTGIRVNAIRRAGGTAVDKESSQLSAAGVGLDWRNARARFSADIGWQNHELDRIQPSVTIAAGLPIPRAPEASTNFAQPYTYSDERDVFGTVRGEFDFTDNVTGWAAFGARSSDEASTFANPRVNDAAGNTSATGSSFAREDSIKTGEIGLRAKFNTGNVGHTINASINRFSFDTKDAYVFYADPINSNIYAPTATAAPSTPGLFVDGSLANPTLSNNTRTSSVAIADTLSFNEDRILLTIGARNQTIEGRSFSRTTGAQLGAPTKGSRITPVAGLVVKANDNLSFYGNYIEGLSQIARAPAMNNSLPVPNSGQLFKPAQSKQKEIGVKYDGGKLGGSLALFTTDQPLTGYDAANTYGLYGEQRNRGLELTAYGEPARGLRVLGGFTLLDAKQTRTQGGATDGNRVIGVPKMQVNAGVEWDVPNASGLTLTGRAVHASSQYADAANTQTLPSWTRLDLGARYLTEVQGRLLTLRADVRNVTDKNYWASAGGFPNSGYLVMGAPRTFMLSASLDF
jgi:iron complex outermembrane receptor protein